MQQKSIMEMADDILGGVLTDSSKVSSAQAGGGSMAMPTEEELPELSEGQHDILMSHILDEGKVKDTAKKVKDTAKKVKDKVKKFAKKVMTPSTPEELEAMGIQDRHKYLTGGDVKPLPKPKKFKADKSGTVRNADRYGEGEIKEMNQLKKPPVAKNLTTEQLDVLQKAKDILGEMTTVGGLGVNMAGGKKSKGGSHHRAMDVKLPGDASQAAAIKAASTPPVFKAKVAKEAAPAGKKKTRVIVKRKTSQSKDDETQIRVHDDMKAMYHESFDSFVDGILLKEDASKGYPGDVSVAEFGRKGPSSNTFGGGGVRSKGRGPKIQLTKNQLMTAKKKGKGSDKDHETPGFGKASSHSRKHPQNPYAGGK